MQERKPEGAWEEGGTGTRGAPQGSLGPEWAEGGACVAWGGERASCRGSDGCQYCRTKREAMWLSRIHGEEGRVPGPGTVSRARGWDSMWWRM